jgi:succinate dehydrogenase / fumarate reductase flavoprotein subunit
MARALEAGADLIDMEMTQFHPTGMVWPPSVRGLLVTEGVRGDGGTLRNSEGRRFMFDYVPEFFRAETASDEREADAWYEDKRNNRRTPDLLPRDEVARAINAEVKAGRGSPHGGVFLDIATRRSPEYIRRRLPSMYQQFKELADVDITKEPMEVGPTLHYIMGGVRVEADTAATAVPGLFAAGEVAAGLHGANRLGGNSLSDLLVFGRRAGLYAAEYARSCPQAPSVDPDEVECTAQAMLAPFDNPGDENPYTLHADLQRCMQQLVGIIRTEAELREALEEIDRLRERLQHVRVQGNRQYNPAWHMALDMDSMLTVSKATTLSAIERKESRGGHTRDDYPNPDAAFARVNVVTRSRNGEMLTVLEPLEEMPDELKQIIEDKA